LYSNPLTGISGKKILDAAPFGYVYGAARGGDTHRGNVDAFQKYRIRLRVYCDISKCDLSISIFGMKSLVPFLLAPIGVNTILDPMANWPHYPPG